MSEVNSVEDSGFFSRRALIREVITAAAAELKISVADMRGDCRERRNYEARRIVAWICKNHLGRSYSEIGRALMKDHSTIIHACRMTEKLFPRYEAAIQAIVKRLGL